MSRFGVHALLVLASFTLTHAASAGLMRRGDRKDSPLTIAEVFLDESVVAIKSEQSAAPLVAKVDKAIVKTSEITQILTIFNTLFLFIMIGIVVKVIMARSETESTVHASEDMSIGKQLPCVLLWCSLGVLLICFNKKMYLATADGGFGFPLPMSLTWFHMITAMIATNIIRLVRPELMPAVHEKRLSWHQIFTAVVPIGVVFGAYLAMGNIAYLYLSVSFIQMLKSAGPMSVFALSVAFGQEKITVPAMCSIAIVVLGVAGASVGEVAFSWFGFAFQFTAFILDGLRLVLLKKLMSSRSTQLDPLSALYYYSPVCVICLMLPVFHFEGHLLATTLGNASTSFYGILALNTLVALALNLSMLAVLKNASATTASMASVVRDIVLTFGSAMIFHSTITLVQALSYLSACLGVKLWDEMKARPDAFYKAFGMQRSDESERRPLGPVVTSAGPKCA